MTGRVHVDGSLGSQPVSRQRMARAWAVMSDAKAWSMRTNPSRTNCSLSASVKARCEGCMLSGIRESPLWFGGGFLSSAAKVQPRRAVERDRALEAQQKHRGEAHHHDVPIVI